MNKKIKTLMMLLSTIILFSTLVSNTQAKDDQKTGGSLNTLDDSKDTPPVTPPDTPSIPDPPQEKPKPLSTPTTSNHNTPDNTQNTPSSPDEPTNENPGIKETLTTSNEQVKQQDTNLFVATFYDLLLQKIITPVEPPLEIQTTNYYVYEGDSINIQITSNGQPVSNASVSFQDEIYISSEEGYVKLLTTEIKYTRVFNIDASLTGYTDTTTQITLCKYHGSKNKISLDSGNNANPGEENAPDGSNSGI